MKNGFSMMLFVLLLFIIMVLPLTIYLVSKDSLYIFRPQASDKKDTIVDLIQIKSNPPTYGLKFFKPKDYTGLVDVKSWVCQDATQKSCSGVVEYRPWKKNDGSAYTVDGGTLTLGKPVKSDGRSYFLSISTDGGPWSTPIVSQFDFVCLDCQFLTK